MPIDILDQPRGGILETVVQYLYNNNGRYLLDSLIKKMTGSEEGRKYFERNVIDLLEALDFMEIKDEEICLKNCMIITRWYEGTRKSTSFEIYFKVQLLLKITKSKNPYVKYFGEVLRRLFDLNIFDVAILEETLREARGTHGVPVSEGEELSGKIDYCLAFLKYLYMVHRIGNGYQIYVPRNLLQTIISLALEDIKKTSVKLYSDLLEHIDGNYLPVLNKRENRILSAVYKTMNDEDFIKFFNFANVPDGGRVVLLANKEYNAIIGR